MPSRTQVGHQLPAVADSFAQQIAFRTNTASGEKRHTSICHHIDVNIAAASVQRTICIHRDLTLERHVALCQHRFPESTGLLYAPYETGYLLQPNG